MADEVVSRLEFLLLLFIPKYINIVCALQQTQHTSHTNLSHMNTYKYNSDKLLIGIDAYITSNIGCQVHV